MRRIKKWIALAITAPLVGRIIQFLAGPVISSRSVKVDVGNAGIPGRTIATLFWRFYESAEYRLISNHLQTDLPVVELGGSIGVITCRCGQLTNQPVISVEANADLQQWQKKNIELNKLALITQVNAGIGYGNQKLYFNQGIDNISGQVTSENGQGARMIPIIQLSVLLNEFKIRDYILVCDIEGAEYDLLEHDREALTHCQQIFMEIHHLDPRQQPRYPDNLIEELRHLGFLTVAKDGMVYCFNRKSL